MMTSLVILLDVIVGVVISTPQAAYFSVHAPAAHVVPAPAHQTRVTMAVCPATPNCVSTEAERPGQRMPAIPFADTPDMALARATAALVAEPRTVIIDRQSLYLRAECRSRLFRFVDDVEIMVDSTARVFRFRSASRVGHSDLGVNRKRMDRISARLREPSAAPAVTR